jgi:soluble lytic murein transglycosylase-like protein
MTLAAILIILFGLWVLSEPALAALVDEVSKSRAPRSRIALGVAIVLAGGVLLLPVPAGAAVTFTNVIAAPRARVQVPDSATVYRRVIESAAAEVWGEQASPSRLAAQIDKESRFNPRARSNVGAEGLAQFMPSTTRWIAKEFPDRLGTYDPWDAEQAVLAAAIYDEYLRDRNPGATACDNWSFALSAYNGGETALHREQRLAVTAQHWFGDVSEQRSRSAAAWRQNRDYVDRILRVLEPSYLAAGWPGQAVCV